MIIGIGTDIIEISRVKRAIESEHFRARICTEAERAYCDGRGAGRAASYAARFAAKEAVMKALGTGLRGGTLQDIEITNDALGAPHVRLMGAFAQIAAEKDAARIHITLSHARDYATAVCVLERADDRED